MRVGVGPLRSDGSPDLLAPFFHVNILGTYGNLPERAEGGFPNIAYREDRAYMLLFKKYPGLAGFIHYMMIPLPGEGGYAYYLSSKTGRWGATTQVEWEIDTASPDEENEEQ